MNSHLKSIVALKEARERRKLGILTIRKESGASRSAIQRLLNNSIKNVPLDDLKSLCVYLNCQPGDILKLEDVENV